MTRTPEILVEVKNRVATLIFNRPERLNAWSVEMERASPHRRCLDGLERGAGVRGRRERSHGRSGTSEEVERNRNMSRNFMRDFRSEFAQADGTPTQPAPGHALGCV